MRKKYFFRFVILLSIFAIGNAYSAVRTSAGTGNWTTGGTWVGGVAPVAGDDAIIANGHTVSLTTNQSITNVTINGNGILNLNTATRTLTVSGSFAMNGTSAINGNGTDRIINVAGNFDVSAGASVTIQNIQLNVTGTLTIANTGTATLNTANTASKSFGNFVNNGTWTNTANNVPFTVVGNFQNNGTFSQGTGRVSFIGGAAANTLSGSAGLTTFNGGITVNKSASTDVLDVTAVIGMTPVSAATELVPTRGIFKISSASSFTPFYQNKNGGAPYDVAAAAQIWVNNAGATLNSTALGSNGSSWSILGTLRLTAGTINVGSGTDDWLAPRSGSLIWIEGGSINVTGRLSQMGEDFTLTMSGGTMTLGTVGNATGSRPPFNVETTTKTINISGGTIVIQNPGLPGTENSGYYNKSTTGTGMTGGTIQIGNGSTPAGRIIEIESTRAIYNLTVNSANATCRVTNAAHTITNDLTITDGILDQSTNSLDLSVGGNWSNTSTIADPFLEGTRTVTFNGTGAQTISSSGAGAVNGTTFYNATINNSYGTVPQITTNANVAVTNTLTMTLGKVNLNSTTLTLGTSAASAGTLTYTAGWLYGGTFQRWLGTASLALLNARGHYPMGNATDYHPLWLAYTANLTTGGTVSVLHSPSASGSVAITNYVDASWGQTVKGISISAWQIASANSFTLSGSNAQLRFGGNGYSPFILTDLNASLVGSAVATHGAATNATVALEVNRTVLSQANLNNTWYIGTKDLAASPLPVSLTSFTAKPKDKKSVLTEWVTASEINNDYFTIERSLDGELFESINKQQGAGNSVHTLNYSFLDENPYSGVSYYRLKQTDFDGRDTYSSIEPVSFKNNYFDFNVYPNPVNEGQTININLVSSTKQEVLVVVIDVLGQEYYSKVVVVENGSTTIAIDPYNNIAAGTYIIKASSDNDLFLKKLIVK